MTIASATGSLSRVSQIGETVWELAELYPRQGAWTVEEYLLLDSNRLVEFDDGSLEFLPMPSVGQQLVVGYLYQLLMAWSVAHKHPLPLLAPLPVEIQHDRYSEPDLVLPGETPERELTHIRSVALVMEIVSPDVKSRQRDYLVKRNEYALARIPEYWIVDPQAKVITVLTLPVDATEYTVYGEFQTGQQATSVLLPEFVVDVTTCFAAGNPSTQGVGE